MVVRQGTTQERCAAQTRHSTCEGKRGVVLRQDNGNPIYSWSVLKL